MTLALKIAAAIVGILIVLLAGVVADANLNIGRQETVTVLHEGGQTVVVDGHSLHVETRGNAQGDATGAPILLIHGFASPGHATFLPWANLLAVRRSLIMPDLLGFGFSERITTPGSYYALKSQAAALAAVLDDLGVKQVDVIGHSYGGAVAAQFALDYPARVRRIVFMDAAVYLAPSPVESVMQWPLGIGRTLVWEAFGRGPFGLITDYCKGRRDCVWLPPTRLKDTTDALRAAMSSRRRWQDGAAADEISNITAPSLVIWGADDKIVPVSDGDRLARVLKANFAIIAGSRHMPYLQQPEKVAQRVLDFLTPR